MKTPKNKSKSHSTHFRSFETFRTGRNHLPRDWMVRLVPGRRDTVEIQTGTRRCVSLCKDWILAAFDTRSSERVLYFVPECFPPFRDHSLGAANKAWEVRHRGFHKSRSHERDSKEALRTWCRQNEWAVAFFEGRSGAARDGIVDAVIVRPAGTGARCAVKLVQLKSGNGGLTAAQIRRLRQAVKDLVVRQ